MLYDVSVFYFGQTSYKIEADNEEQARDIARINFEEGKSATGHLQDLEAIKDINVREVKS